MLFCPIIDKKYSRRGILQAPKTEEQFLERIRSLKIGVYLIADGWVKTKLSIEAFSSIFRVWTFFEVGSRLPINLTVDEINKEQDYRQKFNNPLDGIDIPI